MRLSILCWMVFLLVIPGCLDSDRSISDEALQPFLVIPEEATQIQTYQFGRGMARIMYIKFSLPSNSINTLFEALCIKREELSPTYTLPPDSLSEVPAWFSPASENTSGGSCGTANANYKIIVENQQSEYIIYIRISVL
jgi:hypothetical protein